MYIRYLTPALLFVLLFGSACQESPKTNDYLARVGDRKLTQLDFDVSFGATLIHQDSSEILQQIVEGWIKDELLAQEAVRQGLRNDSEVQRLLDENERQILVSALLNQFYQQNPPEPTDEEIEAYYAQYAEQLALKSDYFRVRYLAASAFDQAEQVRTLLQDATVANRADSLWPSIVEEYAIAPDVSIMLSRQFYPKAMLFSSARLKNVVDQLAENQISAIIEEDNAYHIVQLAESKPAGTIPQLSWIRDELKQRLTIDARKQMIARQVQRLRTEALAREDLDVPYLDR